MTMPFLPNEADATYSDQAEPDSVDFDILLAGARLTGVVSGCAVTESGTPAQTIDVAVGVVRVAGRQVAVAADTGVAVTAADGTNPRIDLISSNLSGVIVVTAGTPAASPVLPAIPATSVPLATLYVPANDNTHGDAQINDKRVTVPAQTVFNVMDYGAVGDGSTDDTTEIQAAMDAAIAVNGTCYFPTADPDYDVDTIGVAAGSGGVTIVGDGNGSRINSISDHVFEFTGTNYGVSMAKLKLYAETAGKACIKITGSITESRFERVDFQPYYGLAILANGSAWGLYGTVFDSCTYMASEPAGPIIELVDTAGGGICSQNLWIGGEINTNAGSSDPTVLIESRGANYLYGNTFQNINVEVPNGGFIEANGTKFLTLRDIGIYDLGTVSDDMVKLGKHVSGLRTEATLIENVNRVGGSLGVYYDIALDDAYDTLIIASGGHTAASAKIDANGMSGTHILRPHADTLDGITTNVSVQMGSDAAREYATAKTLDRSHGVVNMESTATTRAVTLPDNADFAGHKFLIRRDGSNTVTVTRAGSDTFDDAATVKTLGSDGAAIGIFSIGDGEWKIVGTQGTVT